MFFFLNVFFFVLCVKTVFLLRSFEVLSWAETSCGKAWQLSLNVVFTCVSVVLPLLLLLDCVLPWPRLCCCTDANAATVALLKSPVEKKKSTVVPAPSPRPAAKFSQVVPASGVSQSLFSGSWINIGRLILTLCCPLEVHFLYYSK